MTPSDNPSLNSFGDVWKAAFSKLLTQAGANNVTTPDAEPLNLAVGDDPEIMLVRFAGGGSLKGQLQWSVPKAVAVQLAQLLMSEPLEPAVQFTATHLDGFQEFLRQAAGEVAVAWKQASGEPAELAYQKETAPPFQTQASSTFSLESDKTHGLLLRIDLDAEMLASLHLQPAESTEVAPEVMEETSSPIEVPVSRNLPTNLDLILDVQLDATIRFGEREMLLQDVFGLMPGAVVELDHLVNEPAELLVAGRLVAKGEVVVVDGNFGLRVTEVLSRAQRAAALSWK